MLTSFEEKKKKKKMLRCTHKLTHLSLFFIKSCLFKWFIGVISVL